MLNDIKQTPASLKALLETHISLNKVVKGINLPLNPNDIGQIYVIASGSSRNAANIAKYFIEKVAKLSVIVDFAGEFAHRSPVVSSNDLLIPLSQSGETADVLAALNKGRELSMQVFSITNNLDSTIHKLSDSGMVVQAGAEESIPATKSFTCQLMSLYVLGIYLAEMRKTLPVEEIEFLKRNLLGIPALIYENIETFSEKINAAADKVKDFKNLAVLGRGQNWALAEEFALKVQETSYINAFGWAAGEFMHGHLAVLDENFPVVSLLTKTFDGSENYDLAIKNTKEIKTKRTPILIAIGHNSVDFADVFVNIGEQNGITTLFSTALILQLLAFKIADLLDKDVSKPRSLNKTVLNE